MSGILLQLNTDGSEIDRDIFNKMFSVLEHRGPDGSNVMYFDNAALGYQHFWTTPEEINESQPIKRKDRECYLLFDGRLDNRDELFSLYKISESSISDAKLILELYSRFDTEFFKNLVGSYVFVIYDKLKNRITTVRDHLGDKILYYYHDRKKIIIASEPLSILKHPDIFAEINDKKIAEFFVAYEQTDNSSFFKNIYELLPAHRLLLENGEIRIQRYWDLDPNKQIRYKREEEYFDHFRDIFGKSVDCRLRTYGDPGVLMSGGIDSTSIAAYIANTNKNSDCLKTFSYVFDKFKESDERKYIDDICKIYNMESIRVNGDECWPLSDFDSWIVSPNFPFQNPFLSLIKKLFNSVKINNNRTVLTGLFADELFNDADYFLKDYISDLKILSAIKGTIDIARSSGIRNISGSTPIRIALRKFKFIRDLFFTKTASEQKYTWLTEHSKSLLPDKLYWSEFTKNFYRQDQARFVAGLNTSTCASGCISCSTGTLIDLRYPFRDRRLVEYLLQLPAYQFYEDSDYKKKYILKNSFKDILPDSILNRTEITKFDGLLFYGLLNKRIGLIQSYIKEFSYYLTPYIRLEILNEILYRESKDLCYKDFLILWNSFCFILWKNKLKEHNLVRE